LWAPLYIVRSGVPYASDGPGYIRYASVNIIPRRSQRSHPSFNALENDRSGSDYEQGDQPSPIERLNNHRHSTLQRLRTNADGDRSTRQIKGRCPVVRYSARTNTHTHAGSARAIPKPNSPLPNHTPGISAAQEGRRHADSSTGEATLNKLAVSKMQLAVVN
jgi:hypothetical protein